MYGNRKMMSDETIPFLDVCRNYSRKGIVLTSKREWWRGWILEIL
jgi:hypothetical protein